MSLIIKKGRISNLNQSVKTIGQNGNYRSYHSTSFRIDGIAAVLKSGRHNNFSNGDIITAVGKMKKSGFSVYAIRNETTGTRDEPNVIVHLIMGICLVGIGLPLSFIILGIPPLIYGCMELYNAYTGYQAKQILSTN
ncbi:hypothetical protein [Chryseobacterium gambrini]|uniref:hypothetical protein n=1 Tax=Chryseobacterium gambrini TaxID=373672 RepID=UPI003D0FC4CE